MDRRDFAIGTLSVTALVLLAALIILGQLPAPPPAWGFGQTAVGGDYILFSGQVEESNERVYVIDTAVKQMNVYAADPSSRRLVLIQKLDMQTLPVGNDSRRRRPRRY